MTTRAQQLQYNLDDIFGGYENGVLDMGDEVYPKLTAAEWFDYCVPEIYDMKANGHGRVLYADGICDDLRFLGNAYIYAQIIYNAEMSDLLKEDETDASRKLQESFTKPAPSGKGFKKGRKRTSAIEENAELFAALDEHFSNL